MEFLDPELLLAATPAFSPEELLDLYRDAPGTSL
jgi:hypothetical protein